MTARPLIVIFDRQHAGKPSRGPGSGMGEDLGAVMRTPAKDHYEADLTLAYIGHAVEALGKQSDVPVQVHVIDPLTTPPRLTYAQRQARANDIARQAPGARVAYVACHMNAGGGSYALVQHDHRSVRGQALAGYIAEQFGWRLPVGRTRVEPATGAWARGAPCIAGVYSGPANICGVLVEPLFLDCPAHVAHITSGQGLPAIGHAIAAGLLAWHESAP